MICATSETITYYYLHRPE